MENSYTYNASVEWQGERKGLVTSNGLPELQVATPPDFPGGHEGYWSPESYFVASVTSCIMHTFLAIAENSKLSVNAFSANGTGTMERSGKSYEFTRLDIAVAVSVPDDDSVGKAEKILHKAEENCFISNSIKAEVHLEPKISVG